MTTAAELAAILAGAGVIAFAAAASMAILRAQTGTRLHEYVQSQAIVAPAPVLRARPEPQSAIVDRMNRRLEHASIARNLQMQLIRSGLSMPASRFLILQGLVTSIMGLAAYVLAEAYLAGATWEQFVAAAAGLSLGWLGPRWTLKFLEARRLKLFESQLAPTVDSMAGALQAGASLPQAMEMVSREMPPPIGEEFAIVVRELGVGVTMQEAFGHLVERVRSLDLDLLITAISIQYRVGGNLSQILRSIAHTVRERLRIKGEISVLTAQQRMSAYVVSGLPVFMVLVLFLIAPVYVSKLFQPGLPRVMLVIAIIAMGLGYFTMKKITDIDV